MDKFFASCGRLISSHVQELGQFPMRQFISVFVYENGHAKYNGKDWEYVLNRL